jgi:hypothetical protein
MYKFKKKFLNFLIIFLFDNNPWFCYLFLKVSNRFFYESSISRVNLEVDKDKKKVFKKLNQLYAKRKYSEYIKLLSINKRFITEEKKTKYLLWAALITSGKLESKYYIGRAININPRLIDNISGSFIISAYPQKTQIQEYLKKKALYSKYITPLIFCYIVAKYYGLEYLTSISRNSDLLSELSIQEQLELFFLVNDYQQVLKLFEYNKNEVFSLKSYERIYDSCVKLGQLSLAQEIFSDADEIYANPNCEINPHAINNKLERYFWFEKGDLVKGFNTYKRQKLSKVLFVSFADQYTQKLEDIINANSPLVLASWGPGDEIRFSPLYSLLFKLNVSITFTCEPRLYKLLSQRYPAVKFISVKRSRRLNIIDAEKYSQLPHSSLHHLMDNALLTELHKFDKVTLLNDICSELVEDHIQSLQTLDFRILKSSISPFIINKVRQLRNNNKTLIGLCWQSPLESVRRNEHYFMLADMAPLFKLENVIFVNLQYDSYKEIEQIKKIYNKVLVDTNIDLFNDFLGSCYLMQHLDIIVSVGTSVLELAGFSGTKTFALTNHFSFKPRVQKDNRDLWFPNIKYVDEMTHLSKKEVADKIANNIESLNDLD